MLLWTKRNYYFSVDYILFVLLKVCAWFFMMWFETLSKLISISLWILKKPDIIPPQLPTEFLFPVKHGSYVKQFTIIFKTSSYREQKEREKQQKLEQEKEEKRRRQQEEEKKRREEEEKRRKAEKEKADKEKAAKKVNALKCCLHTHIVIINRALSGVW